jgi:hypothetical protein
LSADPRIPSIFRKNKTGSCPPPPKKLGPSDSIQLEKEAAGTDEILNEIPFHAEYTIEIQTKACK